MHGPLVPPTTGLRLISRIDGSVSGPEGWPPPGAAWKCPGSRAATEGRRWGREAEVSVLDWTAQVGGKTSSLFLSPARCYATLSLTFVSFFNPLTLPTAKIQDQTKLPDPGQRRSAGMLISRPSSGIIWPPLSRVSITKLVFFPPVSLPLQLFFRPSL